MLFLISPQYSSRLRYTADLVLSRMLGIPYSWIPLAEYQPALHHPALNYTEQALDQCLWLPPAGLLDETTVSPVEPGFQAGQLPYLFPRAQGQPVGALPFDPLAAIFYLVSEYEKYLSTHLDAHGRYDPTAYPSWHWGITERPLAQEYARALGDKLLARFPALAATARPPQARVCHTFDIDLPWKYKHKGLGPGLGGLLKDLIKGPREQLWPRLRSIMGGPDPYDTYDTLFAHCHPENSHFFFLIERRSQFDSRYTWRHAALRRLIKEIQARGYLVGLHPSYLCGENPALITAEAHQLATIIGQPLKASRQHFLRYRLPDTYRSLLAAGIRADFTPCLYPSGGFPQGMALPYPWFDLQHNEATELMLHPTLLMDQSLRAYLGLSPEQGLARARALWQKTRDVGGTFTWLLHNNALSDRDQWRGWRNTWLQCLREFDVSA